MTSIFLPVFQDTTYNTRTTDPFPQSSNNLHFTDTALTGNPSILVLPGKEDKWNSSTNFFIENGLKDVVQGINKNINKTDNYGTNQRPENVVPDERNNTTYDWLLGIFIFLVVLFVWIRVFYSKFFANLGNALLSFQLSVKLFQERNVLSQRVSIVLDFIYVLVTAIFLFELVEFTGFADTGMSGINLFLLLLNILTLYAILRVIILRITGTLFLATPLFSEYLHNTFVINKGLGIILFPVVIMGHYLPHNLIPVMLVLGLVLLAIALLYKSFRAYQIIIRRDILIFYLILYLCTLEILPLLLGYKFVTSLIQSN